jgi:hypothetical protein
LVISSPNGEFASPNGGEKADNPDQSGKIK